MTYKIEPFLSAIVYIPPNQRGIVFHFLPKLLNALKNDFKVFEIILVNDSNSPLDTDKLKELLPDLREKLIILDLSFEHGLEKAMTAACDLAVGDIIMEFDYPVLEMDEFIPRKIYQDSIESASDIFSYTSKKARKLGSFFFYFLLKKLGVTNKSLKTESIRIISRRAMNKILKERRSFRFRKILYVLSGYRYTTKEEESIQILPSYKGVNRLELAMDVLMSFSKFGSSTSRYLSLLFLLASIGAGVYSIVVRYLGFPVSDGWTTIMVFLTFGFSGLFAILTGISRTLQLILKEVQNSDPYSVREVSKLSNR